MRKMRVFVFLVAAVAYAADGTAVSGPVLGYAVEKAAVRPVYGTPGAALLGPAVDLAMPVVTAAASNAAGYVIAAGEDGRVMLFRQSALRLEVRLESPEFIAVSPKGYAALLYSPIEGMAQIITGLPNSPSMSDPVRLPWRPAVLAVSDRGHALAGAEGALWSVASGRPVTHVAPGQVSAAAFFAGSEDAAFVADGAVYVKRGADITPLADAADAFAIQAGGDMLYVATPKSVIRVELATGIRTELACDFEVTALDAMKEGAVFRLNQGGKEPLYLYDGRGAEPRLLFVPAAPAEGGAAW